MERKHHLRKIRNKTSNKLDYILLGIIIAVAAVLRLWKLGQVPFMHDEFSALIRTDFDNLHDLVTKGIIADTHPAGVQFFLFLWAKIMLEELLETAMSLSLCWMISSMSLYQLLI